jgi:Type VI secretion system/phage-baseplate injector OB domain
MGSDLEAARHRVAQQLAARVQAWADSTQHDPGVSLLDLMAFLADALSYYQDAAADDAGSRFVGVRMQRGRVSIDADWNEAAGVGRFYGIYRAVVIDNVDPQQRRRLVVRAPSVSPDPLGWALPALTVSTEADLPEPGEAVWVLFEAGDSALPVWLA